MAWYNIGTIKRGVFRMKHYELIRVNKTKARRLYNEGISIYLVACKMSPYSLWFSPVELNQAREPDFNKAVNAFIYYNCMYETGYYPHYYIMQEK